MSGDLAQESFCAHRLSTGFARCVHTFSTGRVLRGVRALSGEYNSRHINLHAVFRNCLLACIVWFVAAAAEAADGATLFRLFLLDGTTVVSYGEFARLGDRVILSMPIGGSAEQPRLYVVTLPASRVDWVRTDQYLVGRPVAVVRRDAWRAGVPAAQQRRGARPQRGGAAS